MAGTPEDELDFDIQNVGNGLHQPQHPLVPELLRVSVAKEVEFLVTVGKHRSQSS